MPRATSVLPTESVPGDGRGPGDRRPVVSTPHRPGRTSGATARGLGWSLAVATAAAAGVWASWRVFVLTGHGQAVDDAALKGAHIGQNRLWDLAEPVLDVVSVGFIATAIITCAGIAFVRRRWALALVAAGVLIGANVTTRVLKFWLLDRPALGYGPEANTLPSGHTTAAASVAAAVLLVVPPRARPWAAVLGAGYAGATGVSTLVGQWHRPSDVVAGLLVVLLWGALGCAVLALGVDTAADRYPPTAAVPRVDGRRPDQVGALLLVLAALVTGTVAGGALHSTWFSDDRMGSTAARLTSYGGGALGIVAVAAVAFGVLLVLRRYVTSGSVGVGPRS